MVITISCPSCATSFPVDPNKIPEAGAKVRCSACAHVFRIERPAPEPVVLPEITPWPAAAEAGPPESDASAADVAGTDEKPPHGLESSHAEAPFAAAEERSWPESAEWIDVPAAEEISSESAPAEAEPTLAEPEPTSAEVQPAEAEPASVPGFTFGKRDPLDKARRLARVLVSDMVMYNAERHRLALSRGTLAQDFDEEIHKSWKEFVEQVGPELAEGEGRNYWAQALNEILAKGGEVF